MYVRRLKYSEFTVIFKEMKLLFLSGFQEFIARCKKPLKGAKGIFGQLNLT